MYTLNKKLLHWKNCVIYNVFNVLVFCISSSNKTPAFTLCHPYFRVLHEMQSKTLFQQLRKFQGFEYSEHIN